MFGITKTVYAGLIFKAPSSIGLISGLVGYWSFDGPDVAGNIAYDRSGQGNNGTLTGPDGLPVRDIGKIGQALEFKYPGGCFGEDVTINQSSSINNLSSLTISAWIKPRSLGGGGQGHIITKSTSAGLPVNGWVFYVGDTNGARTFGLRVDYNTTDLEASSDNSVPQINFNEWQHVLVTWDGSALAANIKLYKNGVAVLKNNSANGADTRNDDSASDLLIGNNPGDCRTFDGLIDEVRVYNRALNENEVRRLYRMGATLKLGSSEAQNTGSLTQGLVGYWSFDGPDMVATSTGSAALDRSGSNNTGYLIKSPQRVEGKIGQALDFRRVNDYVKMSNTFTSSAGTVSAWVRYRSLTLPPASGGNNVVRLGDAGCGSGINGLLGTNYGNGFTGNGFGIYDNGLGWQFMSTGVDPVMDTWYHITGTYGPSGMKFYENGLLKDTDTYVGTISGLEIQISDCSDTDVDATVDDVRIYNRVLNEAEVRRLYRMGATLKIGSSQALNTDSLKSGLVGYWSFDGPDMAGTIAYDRSGSYATGTLTSGPQRAEGRIGQGLEFKFGINDYVDIPSTRLNNLSTFTYSAWVKLDRNLGFGGGDPIILSKDTFDKYFAMYSDVTHRNSVRAIVSTNATAADTYLADNSLEPQAWHHVAITYDDSGDRKIYIYVDGKLPPQETQTPASGTINSDSGGDYFIGIGPGTGYSGVIDEFRIYNRVLNSDEIRRLYNMGR